MGYLLREIDKSKSYMFTIGKLGSKPDSRFKDWVQKEIDTAMGSFDRYEDTTYSVAVKQTDKIEMGEKEGLEIEPDKQYIYFDLNYTDPSAGALKSEDIYEIKTEIAGALEELVKNIEPPVTIAAIVLHDCTVEIVSANMPIKPAGAIVDIPKEAYRSPSWKKHKDKFDR